MEKQILQRVKRQAPVFYVTRLGDKKQRDWYYLMKRVMRENGVEINYVRKTINIASNTWRWRSSATQYGKIVNKSFGSTYDWVCKI